jgi:hypothetical protein
MAAMSPYVCLGNLSLITTFLLMRASIVVHSNANDDSWNDLNDASGPPLEA